MLSKFPPFITSYLILIFISIICGEIFSQWDEYPTFNAYKDIMTKFESDYPELCKIDTFGTSIQGREMLVVKVSDNVAEDEAEPEVFYMSTIHGDETGGYVLMLDLIDHLLSNYGKDDHITKLVDSIEIWINPLANPDGTYRTSNNTVQGATRYNANGIDLSRTFPCPFGNSSLTPEKETEAIIALYDEHNFVLSTTFHAGAELICYPWNCDSTPHPDKNWFKYIARGWVELAGWPTILVPWDHFVSQGSDYYVVYGTEMDYAMYFQHCRTIEAYVSTTKLLPESNLIALWDSLKTSLLFYIEQSLYGIRGTVTCTTTTQPLEQAKIFIEDHDTDYSFVRSHSPHGDYYRPIYAGPYDVTFSYLGYKSKTIEDVNVENNRAIILNVKLSDIPISITSKTNSISGISIDIRKDVILIKSDFLLSNDIKIEIYDLMGKKIRELPVSSNIISWKEDNGVYIVRLIGKDVNNQFKVMLTK